MPKHIYYLIMAAIGGSILILFWLFYILLYPFSPSFPVEKIEMVNNILRPSELIELKTEPCRVFEKTTKVRRSVIGVSEGSYSLPMPDLYCDSDKPLDIVVPVSIPEGIYYIQFTAESRISPIRSVDYSFRTQNFEVIK